MAASTLLLIGDYLQQWIILDWIKGYCFRCLKVNHFVWHSYCKFFWPTQYFSSTQVVVKKQKTIFGNEKTLRYSRDFVIIEFNINRFERQSNVVEKLGNGWSLRHMPCIQDKQVWHSEVDLYLKSYTKSQSNLDHTLTALHTSLFQFSGNKTKNIIP